MPTDLAPTSTATLAEQITAFGRRDVLPRCWAPGVWESADGPVVGASYRCDARAEEEFGTKDLREAVRGTDPRRLDPLPEAAQLMGAYGDVNAVVLATRPLPAPLTWATPLGYGETRHVKHFDSALGYAQGLDYTLGWKKMVELRTLATDAGLPRPWPRTRDGLADALGRHLGAKHPDQWPGWFYDGRHLVLRADDGVAADVVAHLAAAARRGTLSIAPNSGPFHSGLFICDADDIGPATRARLAADWAEHDRHMAAVDGVEATLDAAGFRVHFFGTPTVLDCRNGHGKTLQYFVNASTPRPNSVQIHGWFPASELTVERLTAVGEAKRAKLAERAART